MSTSELDALHSRVRALEIKNAQLLNENREQREEIEAYESTSIDKGDVLDLAYTLKDAIDETQESFAGGHHWPVEVRLTQDHVDTVIEILG